MEWKCNVYGNFRWTSMHNDAFYGILGKKHCTAACYFYQLQGGPQK